jgi:hypothetical protein
MRSRAAAAKRRELPSGPQNRIGWRRSERRFQTPRNAVQARCFPPRSFHITKNSSEIRLQCASELREFDSRGTVKKYPTEFGFKFFDRLRERRLGYFASACSTTEVLLFAEGEKVLNVMHLHACPPDRPGIICEEQPAERIERCGPWPVAHPRQSSDQTPEPLVDE